jgi:hypothetical protein
MGNWTMCITFLEKIDTNHQIASHYLSKAKARLYESLIGNYDLLKLSKNHRNIEMSGKPFLLILVTMLEQLKFMILKEKVKG